MNSLCNGYPLFLALGLSLLSYELSAVNRIVLKAEALEDYVKERALDPSKRVQTYLFMKGRYYGGGIADPSMDELSFEDIVQNMAVHLREQNFYPEPESEQSDLLIVVHYGITGAQPDSLSESMGYHSIEEMGDAFGNTGFIWEDTTDIDLLSGDEDEDYEDPGEIPGMEMNQPFGVDPGVEFNYNASLSIQEAHHAASFRKAQLLGMEQAFDIKGSPSEQHLLNVLINQERYFVVLNVYDFQKLQDGEVVLLWRMRYNVRSTGQSFGQAIQNMNSIAGDYFGTNHKGLVMKRLTDRSRVKMGDIEVIDEEEEKLN